MSSFLSVSPIGDGDPMSIPVNDFGPSIAYYVHVLGFTLVERTADSAVLVRGEAKIGLARNGLDPYQASFYFGVSDVRELREELLAKHVEPSELRIDQWGGGRFEVFFAKEPFGVCFCFGQKLS
ncbi:MAG: VOC family protein [Fimbriimonas sp.]